MNTRFILCAHGSSEIGRFRSEHSNYADHSNHSEHSAEEPAGRLHTIHTLVPIPFSGKSEKIARDRLKLSRSLSDSRSDLSQKSSTTKTLIEHSNPF